MSVTNHERPGVYSRYDASTVVKGRGGGRCVGLAALCGKGTAGTLYTFNRYEEAVTAFGGEETLTELVRLLFLNGAAQVKAVPVAEEAGYKAAFSVLEAAEDIAVVVCDSGELTVQQGKVVNEELKHNIKKTVRENVNVSVKASSPEELDELLSKMRPEQLEALKERIRSMESGETVEAEEVIDLEDDDSAETEDVESDE